MSDNFVTAFNKGDQPVLVGPNYIYPGQSRRVLRRHYEEAKENHPSLILSGKPEASPEVPAEGDEVPPEVPAEADEIPVEETAEEAPPEVPAEAGEE